ncbi:MAG: fasciclin domain-containing protein [Acidobacteriota bacterium]
MTKRHASTRALSVMLAATLSVLAGCASVHNDTPTSAAQLAQQPEMADLSTFYKLTQQAGLNDVLGGTAPVTVFAPSNEAFMAMPAATLDKLAKDPEQLKALLSYHMVSGTVLSTDIQANTTLPTLNGLKLNVSKAGDFVTVDDAMASQVDIKTANGVIHKIDRVLTPPAAKK